MPARLKWGWKLFSEKLLTPLVFIVFAVLYFTCLPYTIQHLDSAEIAGKGYLLNVAHPPGYPLQIWLDFIFTHLVPWKTVFWRAALLTMIFSLGTLYLVYATIHRMAPHWTNVLWVIPLGLFPVYWEYSVIPDVFMLHCFLCAGLLHFYLGYPHTPRNVFIMTMLGALGACHHHTIIFLFPLLLHAHLKMPLKVWLIDLGCSLMLMFSFYTSIFMMHPEAPFSWLLVHDWSTLWRHFIRADYGTFNLVPTLAAKMDRFSMFWPQIETFLNQVIYLVPFILLAAFCPLVLWRKKRPAIRWAMLLVCFLLYVVLFIGAINDTPIQYYIPRFYLLPFLLLFFLSFASVQRYFAARTKFLTAFLCIMLCIPLFNLKDTYQEHNYSQNTIIEDHIINFINYLPTDKPTVVFLGEDSSIFGFQYLNVTKTKRKDITFFYPSAFFPLPGHWVKHPKVFQELVIPKAVKNNYQAKIDLDDDILGPNLKKFNFATTSTVSTKKFKTLYLPVGRVFVEGTGEDWVPRKGLLHRHDPSIIVNTYAPRTFLQIYALYAHYYLRKGMFEADHLNLTQAEEAFRKALREVPYCIPALENLCKIKEIRLAVQRGPDQQGQAELKSCKDLVSIMKNITFNYFVNSF